MQIFNLIIYTNYLKDEMFFDQRTRNPRPQELTRAKETSVNKRNIWIFNYKH
ncbi:hypothetical protein Hanom_Chr04g00289571 [Helianthus anomalus]